MLDVPTLVAAYSRGIFPWYSAGQPILWWSTDPRMVLETGAFRLHRSLRKTVQQYLREGRLEIRFDGDFERVIRACAHTAREGQTGTWILPAMVEAYVRLHDAGMAHICLHAQVCSTFHTLPTTNICVGNVRVKLKPINILFASTKVLRALGLQFYKDTKVCVCGHHPPCFREGRLPCMQ